MFNFSNIDLFTQALGIEDPWKLDKVDFVKEKGQLDIYISHKRGRKFPRPECGEKSNIHDTKAVGIDETSSKKGHNYITLFVDLDKSKIIYVTEGKDSSTIDSFALNLKLHQGDPKNIKKVCCDMSPAFIKGSKENFPKAKITFGKFHVMKIVNKAVDQVRREEQANNNLLKRTRYIWLKNPDNLTEKQKESFISLSKMNLKTLRAYNLKLALQEFWDIDNITTAASYLQKWYPWAIRSKLEPMIEVAHFVDRHWQGIIHYIQSRINNGILEGLNSIVQTIKRKARGFRNTNNFITAIYFQCSQLKFDLPEAFI
jgi:transposase